jgi:hypothetical protein
VAEVSFQEAKEVEVNLLGLEVVVVNRLLLD